MHALLRPALAATLALLLLAPVSTADPRATAVNANGQRCYVYVSESAPPELWAESNGVLVGGVPSGTPFDHTLGRHGASGTGLQRASVLLAGPDGVRGTADDHEPPAGAVVSPGPDGVLGTADDHVPADARLDELGWAERCVA